MMAQPPTVPPAGRLSPASIPVPPVVDVPVDPNTSMFAIYTGPAGTQPPVREFQQMDLPTLTSYLGQLVPSGPDQAELSLLSQRAALMPIGAIDHIRTGTLNTAARGAEAGMVQIVRLR